MHEIEEPTRDEDGTERHPAWAMIGANRWSNAPGAVLFDSDIQHQRTVVVTLQTAVRKRDLNRDWLGSDKQIVQVAMSEAQWASFVSSMGVGSGVPCTLLFREGADDPIVPGMPYEPRLRESMDEVRGAADEAMGKVWKAFEAYKEKKNAGNLRTLEFAIRNAAPNVEYTAKTLVEHAENVVQKARVDIEAMVTAQAQRLGLEPGDLLASPPQLMPPDES